MTERQSARRISATAGHWTDSINRTGCTVVLFDQPAEAVIEVRGGAPGTRETSLLGAGDLVQSVDSILLTGGSAFGLEAAGGVMAYLRERGRGVRTPGGPVPIVPAAVLYDLAVGSATWPTPANGRAACEAAAELSALPRGQVGAGTGATVRKAFPGIPPESGGFGVARIELGGLDSVSALVAVNALGEIVRPGSTYDRRLDLLTGLPPRVFGRTSTTLAVVVIDADVDRRTLSRCAIAAHDAFARVIRPCHTIYDGDVVFATALGSAVVAPDSILAYSTAVEIAVERAIIDAVTS
ncbi:MAG: P1 family peptidase [Thermomicrobiales bacterium]|nr:P1 family peptidase [Thermomicrobiales bacterium]